MIPVCSAYYLVCFQKSTDRIKDFLLDGLYGSDRSGLVDCRRGARVWLIGLGIVTTRLC